MVQSVSNHCLYINLKKENIDGEKPNEKYRPTVPNGELWGWQYTSSGRVNGITGNVDMNEVYYDITALKQENEAVETQGRTAENFVAQTKALANIGDMYAERYDIPNTYKYYDTAKSIALETDDNKTKGYVWSRSADALVMVNENLNALKDYKSSAQYYENTDSPMKTAKNYEKAAQIMLQLGNTTKAQKLLAKAQQIASTAPQTDYL